MPVELTILVKKKDGSTQRVPLSSVLKNFPAKSTAEGSFLPNLPQKSSVAVPAVIKSAALSPLKKEVPAKKLNDRPIPVKLNSDWHTSLLEEAAPTAFKNSPADLVTVSAPRLNEADKIIKSLSFTVPADLANRLRSLVQLRVKDVRTALQTEDTAKRPTVQGGLALTAVQAEELEAKCAAGLGKTTGAVAHGPRLPSEPSPSVPVVKQSAPLPNNLFKIGQPPFTKVSMHDVVPLDNEVGPIDEIRLFSLTDLRRLGSVPTEAVARLRQKFLNLREESILFYLDSLNAWRESSLFGDYIKRVATAAESNKSLAALAAATPDKVTPEEVAALARLNRELLT